METREFSRSRGKVGIDLEKGLPNSGMNSTSTSSSYFVIVKEEDSIEEIDFKEEETVEPLGCNKKPQRVRSLEKHKQNCQSIEEERRKQSERKSAYDKKRYERLNRIADGQDHAKTEKEKLLVEKIKLRREASRLRKQQRRAKMTAEEREAYKEKDRIRKRERRQRMKNMSESDPLTEQYEAIKEKDRNRKGRIGQKVTTQSYLQKKRETQRLEARQRRAKWTKEQYELFKEKNRDLRRKWRQEMKNLRESLQQAEREAVQLRTQQTVADMTEEQREAAKENARKRQRELRKEIKNLEKNIEQNSEPEKEAVRLLNQQYKSKLEKELYESHIMSDILKKFEITEEDKKKKRINDYFWYQSWKAQKSEEEWAKINEKRIRVHRNWKSKLTGEKKQRHQESVRRAVRKHLKKKRELLKSNPNLATELWKKKKGNEKFYTKILENQRRKTATETPEERLKRLHKYKVNSAKRKLRKELTEKGAGNAEIDRKLKALGDKLWAEWDASKVADGLSEYKPRPRGRKPKSKINKGDLTDYSSYNLTACETTEDANTSGTLLLLNNTDIDKPTSSPVAVVTDNFALSNDYSYEAPPPCISITPGTAASSISEESFHPALDDDNFNSFPNSPAISSTAHDDDLTSAKTEIPQIPQFPCKHCSTSESFPSETTLRDHLRTFHFSTCWKCPKCKEVMLSPQELSKHFTAFHSNQQQSTVNSSSSSSQQLENSDNESHRLDLLPTSSNISNNLKSSTNTIYKFNCMKCPWKLNHQRPLFETRQGLFEHVRVKHKESYWPCHGCFLLKYSKESLEVHKKLCDDQTHV